MAGHQLLILPSYRALERHDWSRLSLMARLSLVHMHRRRLDSSQTFDSCGSRIVVEYVPRCGRWSKNLRNQAKYSPGLSLHFLAVRKCGLRKLVTPTQKVNLQINSNSLGGTLCWGVDIYFSKKLEGVKKFYRENKL